MKKAATEPSNWAEIKKNYGWPTEAEWWTGREIPNKDNSIKQKKGRRGGTSVDPETHKLIYPKGTAPPKQTATGVNTIMPTPCRKTGGGTAGAADEGTVQWLQKQLDTANQTNAQLAKQLNENVHEFGEWKSDDSKIE